MSLPRVLVLNGGSSSGTTSVARELQRVLDGSWLLLGVDTLLEALPPGPAGGVAIGDDGTVPVGEGFRVVEDRWMAGVAGRAHLGAHLLVEDVLVSGRSAQDRWRAAPAGLPVGWVGVRCDPTVAARRERGRADRVAGTAVRQALAVHEGIDHDLEVDTGREPPAAVARRIQQHFDAWSHG